MLECFYSGRLFRQIQWPNVVLAFQSCTTGWTLGFLRGCHIPGGQCRLLGRCIEPSRKAVGTETMAAPGDVALLADVTYITDEVSHPLHLVRIGLRLDQQLFDLSP